MAKFTLHRRLGIQPLHHPSESQTSSSSQPPFARPGTLLLRVRAITDAKQQPSCVLASSPISSHVQTSLPLCIGTRYPQWCPSLRFSNRCLSRPPSQPDPRPHVHHCPHPLNRRRHLSPPTLKTPSPPASPTPTALKLQTSSTRLPPTPARFKTSVPSKTRSPANQKLSASLAKATPSTPSKAMPPSAPLKFPLTARMRSPTLAKCNAANASAARSQPPHLRLRRHLRPSSVASVTHADIASVHAVFPLPPPRPLPPPYASTAPFTAVPAVDRVSRRGCQVSKTDQRIFSGGRDTISLQRASLNADTIRILMLVKKRLHLMHAQANFPHSPSNLSTLFLVPSVSTPFSTPPPPPTLDSANASRPQLCSAPLSFTPLHSGIVLPSFPSPVPAT
ncbi:hypothetical protein BC826DRAFT_1111117 [Russula brevipes]|nr:hypothetical protein BC826DRAFT_1111117 [Russula brevipes]